MYLLQLHASKPTSRPNRCIPRIPTYISLFDQAQRDRSSASRDRSRAAAEARKRRPAQFLSSVTFILKSRIHFSLSHVAVNRRLLISRDLTRQRPSVVPQLIPNIDLLFFFLAKKKKTVHSCANMPKAGTWPVSGLFGLNKPSHVITMSMLNDLKELLSSSPVFVSQPAPISSDLSSSKNPNQSVKNSKGKRRGGKYAKPKKESTVKMGQGGTLDPLANGVLVVGIGEGTKQLQNFLHCSKSYRATGLLGCSTDSYDSEGKVVRRAKARHLKREDVEGVLDRFRGDLQQTPPV